jgi:hypothetical protein
MKRTVSILIIITYLIVSCSKRSGDNGSNIMNGGGGGPTALTCTSTPKAFAADVNPIIQSFCNIPNCHNSGSTNGPGALTNYSQVFNSRTAIRSAIATGIMPQNATLSLEQKNSIICWIDSGAPDN